MSREEIKNIKILYQEFYKDCIKGKFNYILKLPLNEQVTQIGIEFENSISRKDYSRADLNDISEYLIKYVITK